MILTTVLTSFALLTSLLTHNPVFADPAAGSIISNEPGPLAKGSILPYSSSVVGERLQARSTLEDLLKLSPRQGGCESGYGLCSTTGSCCPLGGSCCRGAGVAAKPTIGVIRRKSVALLITGDARIKDVAHLVTLAAPTAGAAPQMNIASLAGAVNEVKYAVAPAVNVRKVDSALARMITTVALLACNATETALELLAAETRMGALVVEAVEAQRLSEARPLPPSPPCRLLSLGRPQPIR
ncbi:hypothetical protein FA13DRAFT_1809741 [Coprinellus micaceus]|uniref:Hydrophobin n=1 Tax=Coprinellus micaceus TaxID=71717 RepID=A0A4Y7TSE4_COPMI|nr:hypothetical protein FA13DRAFT_1809741 [Coprinellus micaceus]